MSETLNNGLEPGACQGLSRRQLLAGTAMSLAVLSAAGLGFASTPQRTPAMSAGPFYPPERDRFSDQDWDLVRVDGATDPALGQVLDVAGRVLDADGRPITGARVEIWQCDVRGRYRHRGDHGRRAERDPGFQGYGAVVADGAGRYRFRTIRPVAYPGRAPHIHARVTQPDGRSLTTQLFVAGDPANDQDWLFRRLGPHRWDATLMSLSTLPDGTLTTGFDFII